MIDSVGNVLVAALAIAFLIYFIRYLFEGQSTGSSARSLGIGGDVVWMDQGNVTKAFRNKQYLLIGKPDFIVKHGHTGALIGVEYKSRKRGVYQSDIKQAMAAALAARGDGWNISKVRVITESAAKQVDLPQCDQQLFGMIAAEFEIARAAMTGAPQQATPYSGKCAGCAYNGVCKDAM